ncbi:MAG: hypothetical protein ACFUZC_10265 [Chthoniobacteraceae bacterium]
MNVEKDQIDRQAVVARHNVVATATDLNSPCQVGNGEFAFGADITGLQTFVPFATMAQWGWHSDPLPKGERIEDFRGQVWDTHGRSVRYPMDNEEQPALSEWLASNPHRLNLGRLGMVLFKSDGAAAEPRDVQNAHQQLDLWRGEITSRFEIEGQPVNVQTCCSPRPDGIAVRIQSPLITSGRLAIRLSFPYGDGRWIAPLVGDWDHPERHKTEINRREARRIDLARTLDSDRYAVSLAWSDGGEVAEEGHHAFLLSPSRQNDTLEFVCLFTPNTHSARLPSFAEVRNACATHWEKFWRSGAAIDLSASSDPRWRELERRIVLSQYLMAANEAGTLPPQESGLVNNGWRGRFHFEMYWWHAAHYALWNRWPLLERSLGIYSNLLASSQDRARRQGYRGARWPKCTGPDGREWPHAIHALLIWQQPHPIAFAELDYRTHPTLATLEKWRTVVFETAEFLASFAFFDKKSGHYVLGEPLYVVSENTDPKTTRNPAFELSQWRTGLRLAQLWRERLGLPRDKGWDEVLHHLTPLPVENELYVLHEGVQEMWTKWNFEHPALIGVFGMLPGDGADKETVRRTFHKVLECWKFDRTWGWDFPMLAMCAAKLGEPETAIDMLLHPAEGFQFDTHGLATGGPFPYFPSNGGLLYAVAMMAGGWDGAPQHHAPGFPNNGRWKVRCEGFQPAP